MHKQIKWLAINGATVFLVWYAQYYYEIVQYLLHVDPLRVTLLIPAIYAIAIGYSGLYVFGLIKRVNFVALDWYGGSLMGIGLVGTLYGTGEIFHAFVTADVSQLKELLIALADGLSRALITTMFGIGFSLALGYHNALVFGKYGSEQ